MIETQNLYKQFVENLKIKPPKIGLNIINYCFGPCNIKLSLEFYFNEQ